MGTAIYSIGYSNIQSDLKKITGGYEDANVCRTAQLYTNVHSQPNEFLFGIFWTPSCKMSESILWFSWFASRFLVPNTVIIFLSDDCFSPSLRPWQLNWPFYVAVPLRFPCKHPHCMWNIASLFWFLACTLTQAAGLLSGPIYCSHITLWNIHKRKNVTQNKVKIKLLLFIRLYILIYTQLINPKIIIIWVLNGSSATECILFEGKWIDFYSMTNKIFPILLFCFFLFIGNQHIDRNYTKKMNHGEVYH